MRPVNMDRLLSSRFRVHRIFPISQPSPQRATWLVRWQDYAGGIKQIRHFPTEEEALAFRNHLAREQERTQSERSKQRVAGHPPANPHRSRGGGAKPPELINRREQPRPGLWVTVTTAWRDHRTVYTVAVVTDTGEPMRKPTEHTTPARARRAANNLYARYTEEN
ncbi:hypothetical protein [Nocardioides terrisoli]|uniref:hypothetical protein n=1 Tax=Nocardioides terrisoli TaxID=3388267 RepID=UPI00287B5D06|nr:hypothetical protein [Nocardioides marmorisolisilvae]